MFVHNPLVVTIVRIFGLFEWFRTPVQTGVLASLTLNAGMIGNPVLCRFKVQFGHPGLGGVLVLG